MTRIVTGYYHMSAWRYRSKTHSIVVIASERIDAAAAAVKFLDDHGYYGLTEKQVALDMKPVRNISSTATVIVAVTDIVIDKV